MNGHRGPRTDRGGADCRRTSGVIDRIVADTLTAADREHAAMCSRCGPVLARAARFDDALRRTARGFAAEELPRGILDPGMAGGVGDVRHGTALRGFQPGLAGVAAAVAILILATGVALAPGGIDGPTDTPPPVESSFTATVPLFHTSAVIEVQAETLKYECVPGGALATFGTRPGQAVREGIVCATPKEATTMAAIITGESADGEVVYVSIKGDLVGTTVPATAALAAAMAKLTFAAIADPVDAPLAGDWVNTTLPDLRVLPAGDDATTVIGEVRLTLQRSPAGSFFLLMEPGERG